MPIDFTPQEEAVVEAVHAPTSRLPHHGNAPFRLMHHPLCWDFVDGHGWLPSLRSLVLEPGLNAVEKDGSDDLAYTIKTKAGWTILPLHAVPPGTPGGSYLKRIAARGGWYHCEVWEQPLELGGRVVDSRVDLEGRHRWLRWLVDEGHIAPMREEAKQYQVSQIRSEADRLQARADRAPHLEKAAALKADKLAAMTAPEPATAKKGRRSAGGAGAGGTPDRGDQ